MSVPRTRVLHCVVPGAVGGLERVVELLAEAQARNGMGVAVAAVVSTSETPGLVKALRGTGVDLRCHAAGGRAYLDEFGFLHALCRELRPEVVHTHGYRADVIAGLAARRAARPRVSTVHGFTGGGPKNRLYEWLQRRMIRRFDAVVAVSEPLRRELLEEGFSSSRLHCVRNGWEPPGEPLDRSVARRRLGIDEKRAAIGWVGRLTAEKGADVAIRALRGIRDRPVDLHIVGEGRERSSLESLTRSLDLSDRVRWHGRVPDAWRLFPAFDVFALSSRTEGTPMVLFEAIHAGVPVVATAVGGIPDVFDEVGGPWAFLVPPRDPESLGEAVRRALAGGRAPEAELESRRLRLKEAFGVDAWVERYEAVYDRAGARTAARGG